jgi:signal transduction histidine kinase
VTAEIRELSRGTSIGQSVHAVEDGHRDRMVMEQSLIPLGLELQRLKWEDILLTTGSEEFPLAIGIDPPGAWNRIDGSWRKGTARLLRWALNFDQSLRDRKLEAMAEYAAGAGHEINNPLGSIIGRTSQLLKSEPDPERRRLLENIGAQAYRIRDMIGDTMLFARPPAPAPQLVHLSPMIADVANRFEEALHEKSLSLRLEFSSECRAFADPEQVTIVLSELLRNAIHNSEPGSQISLHCELDSDSVSRLVCFTVVDRGRGMSAEEMEHCFDPFYSGRSAGRGLGFGLSKCWRILQQQGGTIHLVRKGEETHAIVRLPAESRRQD